MQAVILRLMTYPEQCFVICDVPKKDQIKLPLLFVCEGVQANQAIKKDAALTL